MQSMGLVLYTKALSFFFDNCGIEQRWYRWNEVFWIIHKVCLQKIFPFLRLVF